MVLKLRQSSATQDKAKLDLPTASWLGSCCVWIEQRSTEEHSLPGVACKQVAALRACLLVCLGSAVLLGREGPHEACQLEPALCLLLCQLASSCAAVWLAIRRQRPSQSRQLQAGALWVPALTGAASAAVLHELPLSRAND